ncbi:MaoC/PaaZ C-terminal domain-containing protein [Acidithrix ferrooxidans]|uniref:Bifunctional protein PaaZ n=1 Tax=Acidithrix ferrooxidans TaxID=1280514 RepID=A0A0D8HH94_9ACTN|nr:MaoC/PaaZ C-terminal domain-containing protein [Acidithrix ferrooxidans]KJF15987.1 bifunctional protein PaaZ [Acidithrix ferrooxidans]KJF17303.1 bifunctional protein PaaZ [Acidithrix ferrooxidans]
MPMYFDDFEVGQTFIGAGRTFTEAEIITFAHSYDPQSMHIDRVHAEDGSFKGLIASGFHTLSIAWWLFLKLGLVEESMKIGIGVDELRWRRPVRPGDTVTLNVEIVEKSLTSANDSGRVQFAHTLKNQANEVVMTYKSLNLIWRKGYNEIEN